MYVINRPRSVRMRHRATRKRSRPCLFRSLRSPTNALHSPSYLYVTGNVQSPVYKLLYFIWTPRAARALHARKRKGGSFKGQRFSIREYNAGEAAFRFQDGRKAKTARRVSIQRQPRTGNTPCLFQHRISPLPSLYM